MLIGARALQGAFGALLAPAALSILSTTFSDPAERGKAFGVYGAIAGGGGAVGLLLGGILTEYLSWRWCMLVNLAFAIPAAIGAFAILRDQRSTAKVKIDIPGTIAATVGLFGLVYGFSSAEMNGWGDAADDRQPRRAASPSWPRSSRSSAASRSRCCRCGCSPTAPGPARSSPCSAPAPGCSASSCS